MLGRELWAAYTPLLVAAWVLIAALVRQLPPLRRPRMRGTLTLIAIHVILLVAIVAQRRLGYDPGAYRIASLAFQLLAGIGLVMIGFFRLALPTIGVNVPRILLDIVAAVAVIVAMIAVGKRAGFSVAGLITTSAVLTAVIGFSMQDTLGNIMGGLALQLDNSIKVGDWISLGVGQPLGKVTEIRWRYTSIETRNWETIIVPNSALMKTSITVLGRRSIDSTLVRRSVEFNVDFRTAPTDVISIVERAMRTDPPPVVQLLGFRDSYAVYAVRYWLTDLSSDDGGDTDVRVRLFFALSRAGIPLSIPAQAVFVTEESAERRDRKETEELERRLDTIDRVDLFRPIQGDLRRRLANALQNAPFARNEAITREGDLGDDALYVIVRGEASVRIGGLAGRQVALLGPGQFFGEMSLMTGEKRSATVVAASDLVCYRLDKTAFENVLREHPDIAEQVAEVLAHRREELAAVKGELEDVRRRRLETEKENILGRIRGFFGLFDEE
jgi:small-conductance mechanosensitive channel/CRP-like cAMP-binding protein